MSCYSPGSGDLGEPVGQVAGHDDERVLQLTVGFGRQLTTEEL